METALHKRHFHQFFSRKPSLLICLPPPCSGQNKNKRDKTIIHFIMMISVDVDENGQTLAYSLLLWKTLTTA